MKVGRRTANRHRGKIVFHFLQFALGDWFVFQSLHLRVNRRFNIARLIWILGLAADVEHPCIFAGHLVGECRGRHFAPQHKRLVQSPGSPGQHRGQHIQRMTVGMPRRGRMPQDVHLRIGLRLGVHPFFHFLRHLSRDHFRRVFLSARDSAKVTLAEFHHFIGLEIPHENQRDVLRRIVD